MGHFDLKSWVNGGNKIRPGIPNNWRIFEFIWIDIESLNWRLHWLNNESQNWHLHWVDNESQNWHLHWLDIESQNWLSISSQFRSNIFQLLRIPGQILIPPGAQLFRSKWLHFFLSVHASLREKSRKMNLKNRAKRAMTCTSLSPVLELTILHLKQETVKIMFTYIRLKKV